MTMMLTAIVPKVLKVSTKGAKGARGAKFAKGAKGAKDATGAKGAKVSKGVKRLHASLMPECLSLRNKAHDNEVDHNRAEGAEGPNVYP